MIKLNNLSQGKVGETILLEIDKNEFRLGIICINKHLVKYLYLETGEQVYETNLNIWRVS